MKHGNRHPAAGLFIAFLIMLGAAGMLSACNTVSGFGHDLSDLGRNVSSDAQQARPR